MIIIIIMIKTNKKNSCTGIFHDFLGRFAFNFTSDVLDIVSSPFLIGFNELVEISFVPNGEALRLHINKKKHTHKIINL